MAATWRGFLTFGLISIPIDLSPAARTDRISFNQLHSVCHSRLRQPLFCPTCDRFVERSEVEKGYEYEKDQYLLFKKEELEEIEPESAKTMEILQFVKADEIDPVYFDSSYYATPKQEGTRAYHLLLNAMSKTGYAGVAKVTMFGRENIIIIRARENGLILHTMFYPHEVRSAGESAVASKSELKERESKLAMQLIETLASPFQPDQFSDSYQEVLQKLIDAKAHGQKLAVVPHAKRAPVIDLMEALKQSLNPKSPTQKPPVQKEVARKGTLLRAVPKPGETKKRKSG